MPGLPAGVLNLVQGEKDTGIALANHRQIDGLFFTGSSDTGTLLHKQFGGRPEIVLALEMGGNNPLVIGPVADLDAAVHHTIQSAFLSAGQRCTCARRIFVPNDAFGDRFIERLTEVTSRITVGEYNAEPQPFMGAVISARAAQRLVQAQAQSARSRREVAADDGAARPATRLRHARDSRRDRRAGSARRRALRTAGADRPLCELSTRRIERANDTEFGLSAGLLADDEALWTHFQRTIRAGIVNWNRPTNGASSGGAVRWPGTLGQSTVRARITPPTTARIRWLPSKARNCKCPRACRRAFISEDRRCKPLKPISTGSSARRTTTPGLSFGNVASQNNEKSVANPKAAAKQGLRKMKQLADLGFHQGVLPPQERPSMRLLRELGFSGDDATVIARVAKDAPELLAAASSASAMWTANAATVSPSADTHDGRVHFTPANLCSKLHRAIEHESTRRTLRAIFADAGPFRGA